MKKQASLIKRDNLEGRILYYGPPEKAQETKEFVKELLEREIIDVKPAVYSRKIEGRDFKVKVRAENKDGFTILGNKEMLISPNDRDYRISDLRRHTGEDGIKIDFADLVKGKIAFSYKDHDIILFRDYTDRFGS